MGFVLVAAELAAPAPGPPPQELEEKGAASARQAIGRLSLPCAVRQINMCLDFCK